MSRLNFTKKIECSPLVLNFSSTYTHIIVNRLIMIKIDCNLSTSLRTCDAKEASQFPSHFSISNAQQSMEHWNSYRHLTQRSFLLTLLFSLVGCWQRNSAFSQFNQHIILSSVLLSVYERWMWKVWMKISMKRCEGNAEISGQFSNCGVSNKVGLN
jgi:hypothetical protein